jgi:threonine dehydrogenase-like Zn-dependent dehydrogenase
MKAWRVHAYGQASVDDVPEPVVKPGWVKVKVRVAQPSITECLLFNGEKTYLHGLVADVLKQGPGQLFGHEFSGVVTELGEGCHTLKVGQRVAARGSHPEGFCGFHFAGAFAEYVTVPESMMAPLPDNVSDSEGAVIQVLTDSVAGVHAAQMVLGDVAVVLGQGAIGLTCMQVARVSGAGLVIAVARRDSTLEMSRRMGADIVINTTREDVVARVREITGGLGADVVFETAGGPPEQGLAGDETMRQAMQMVRDSGRIVGMAYTGDGAFLPYAAFRGRSLRMLFPSQLDQRLFQTTINLVASGRVDVKSLVSRSVDGLDKVTEAFEMTANKAKYGLINPAQVVISQ